MPDQCSISVCVRVRPLNEAEKAETSTAGWTVQGNVISEVDKTGEVVGDPYTVDHVFDAYHDTESIYNHTTKSVIQDVMDGVNATVFAYGQTSSGKTHTMRGSNEDPGVIPRAIEDIFHKIQDTTHNEFLVRVAYMELYNEDIRDLLAPSKCKLAIHEDATRGPYVAGLHEQIVSSPDQLLRQLELGEKHRSVGETNMNKTSSRSHSIFRIVVESRRRAPDSPAASASGEGAAKGDTPDKEEKKRNDTIPVLVSCLTLVDLAGSERLTKTGAEGQRKKEGVNINLSLSSLGNVIYKLSEAEGDKKKAAHIPYRDSKLTRILQPSLGGNSRTTVICNVTPARLHQDETKSTLKFACRAKRVKNTVSVNEIVTDQALLRRQQREIEQLRHKLAASKGRSNSSIDEEVTSMRNKMLALEKEKQLVQSQLQEEQSERLKHQKRAEEEKRKFENLQKFMIQPLEDQAGASKDKKDLDASREALGRSRSSTMNTSGASGGSTAFLASIASSQLRTHSERSRSKLAHLPIFESMNEGLEAAPQPDISPIRTGGRRSADSARSPDSDTPLLSSSEPGAWRSMGLHGGVEQACMVAGVSPPARRHLSAPEGDAEGDMSLVSPTTAEAYAARVLEERQEFERARHQVKRAKEAEAQLEELQGRAGRVPELEARLRAETERAEHLGRELRELQGEMQRAIAEKVAAIHRAEQAEATITELSNQVHAASFSSFTFSSNLRSTLDAYHYARKADIEGDSLENAEQELDSDSGLDGCGLDTGCR